MKKDTASSANQLNVRHVPIASVVALVALVLRSDKKLANKVSTAAALKQMQYANKHPYYGEKTIMVSRRLTAVVGLLALTNMHAAFGGEAVKSTVIHLSHFSDNLHATTMALKLTNAVQKRRVPVVLFLDLEGVRLADKRQPQNLRWGSSEPVSTYFDAFVKDGGKILVCPHCAPATGLDSNNLRENARIATEDELGEMVVNADKIMDY
ncbi:MAG: DsrE family protein [Candidatus Obscuribacter sp.]|nr:DsrE family protein [Candidatus Obscuribacter sp.]